MKKRKKKTPINELPLEYRRVVSLIPIGSEKPVRVSEISKLTGTNRDTVRHLVNKLIVTYNWPIGTSNKLKQPGYYLLTNEDERTDTIKNLEGRSLKIQIRANALKEIEL